MQLSAYELALIAGGFGIAGTLIGVLGTYRLSLKLADRQLQHAREIAKVESRHVAARAFVEAFANDVRFFESEADEDIDAMGYLREAFQRHSKAVATFEHFLPLERRRAFRAKWQEHCYGRDTSGLPESPGSVGIEHSSLLYLHYGIEYNLKELTAAHAIAAKTMRALLAYAET